MAIDQSRLSKDVESDLPAKGVGRERNSNPDAITGAPGSHPVGTGVGAAGGGIAGAAAGAAIGSVVPVVGTVIGGAIGAAIGATGGGLVGKGVAEEVNPTVEDAYWRENYKSRPYAANAKYDEFQPAYRYGWEAQSRYKGRRFEDVESELGQDWNKAKNTSSLAWDRAKSATRDAWERVERPESTRATADVSAVNSLIETLKDGKDGFESSANSVKDASLKSLFTELSQQRAKFASELQSLVAQTGGVPENSGSAAAAVHRGWIDLKASLGGGDGSILNEAERGEDAAVKSYAKASESNLTPELTSAVRRQAVEIKKAHDRVRDLRNAWNVKKA